MNENNIAFCPSFSVRGSEIVSLQLFSMRPAEDRRQLDEPKPPTVNVAYGHNMNGGPAYRKNLSGEDATKFLHSLGKIDYFDDSDQHLEMLARWHKYQNAYQE